MFTLHPRLEADTFHVCDLKLCTVRLMNDKAYPWVILVPKREDIREIHTLSEDDQQRLTFEISNVAAAMEAEFEAQKMNVAALGNMVPQLHIHVIARYEDDAAWPGPVWGVQPAKPYSADDRDALLERLRTVLQPQKKAAVS